jgi:hypothetical protein
MIIWLASYPKSGNTFLRSLLSSYFFTNDGVFNFEVLNTIKQFPHYSLFKKIGVNLSDEKQVLENYVKAQELFNTKESLQFVKTHSSLLKGFTNYRNTLGVIYIVRDPRNVVISAANHFNTTVEESVSRLINYTNLGGDINDKKSVNRVTTHLTTWSMHYNSWKTLKKRERYLLIKYEDLTKNTEQVFIKILDFIHNLINQKYILDKLKMKNMLKTTSFDYVQKLEKEKKFPEKAKHGDKEEKTFFKYGPKENKKEILNIDLKEKIEDQLKNDMTELGYL